MLDLVVDGIMLNKMELFLFEQNKTHLCLHACRYGSACVSVPFSLLVRVPLSVCLSDCVSECVCV